MKVWSSIHTFDYPWEMVTRAACRKYPNPCNQSVIGTDVIDRKVINGTLYTHKLVTTEWSLPVWAYALIGYARICFASERSKIDLTTKEMVIETRNLTYHDHINVDETIRYTPHPNDANKTLLTQEAKITVTGVPWKDYVEELLTAKISRTAIKGRGAIDWIIQKSGTFVKDIATSTSTAYNETCRQLEDLIPQTK